MSSSPSTTRWTGRRSLYLVAPVVHMGQQEFWQSPALLPRRPARRRARRDRCPRRLPHRLQLRRRRHAVPAARPPPRPRRARTLGLYMDFPGKSDFWLRFLRQRTTRPPHLPEAITHERSRHSRGGGNPGAQPGNTCAPAHTAPRREPPTWTSATAALSFRAKCSGAEKSLGRRPAHGALGTPPMVRLKPARGAPGSPLMVPLGARSW